ncbi:aspartyl protease family protein [Sphingobium sp. YR768]|uniref:aspartyl protease family protein n=1 Tax=Sphingobium sp. YR768 TaxID=1884365 RepID=UPI0008BED76A|nr:aspartyl protease family protein [Sphingobium sp. YR768]SER26700.1 Predicted aspartyl protease [Sphingobium sp. YR768]
MGPIVASELPERADGTVMAGIIVLDVMGGYLVDFDLPSARLSLLDGAEAKALVGSLGPAVPARSVNGGLLAVPVKVNGVTGWGVIDTGARETRINTRFANLAQIAVDRAGMSTTVYGATNSASSLRPGQTRSVHLLGRELGVTSIRIADLPVFETFGLQDEPAMIIGADYLGRFRLVIDFPTRRVWLR